MKLTNENYFSKEAMKEYLSVSQFKSFIGTGAFEGCPACAMAELNGEYTREISDAMLKGSYVDCMLTEPHKAEGFAKEHPEMFSTRGETKGQLKSTFTRCIQMVDRVKKDEMCMKFLDGEKQKILTGELFGAKWKIKVDALETKFITDLKTCESITKTYYSPVHGRYVNFIDYYDYVLQAGIYQRIVEQNIGKRLPFFILAVSSETVTDIGIYQIDNESIDERLKDLESQVSLVQAYKSGQIEPPRCEHCNYCKETKVITAPLNYLQLGGKLD